LHKSELERLSKEFEYKMSEEKKILEQQYSKMAEKFTPGEAPGELADTNNHLKMENQELSELNRQLSIRIM
jgi:hypothetical protein